MNKTNLIYLFSIIVLISGSIVYLQKINNKEQKNNQEKQYNTFVNDSRKLKINYPLNWRQTNLADEEKKENIAIFYDGKNGKLVNPQENWPKIFPLVKITRSDLQDEIKISSSEDWYNFIKNETEKYQKTDTAKNSGYQLISLEKVTITGKWAVKEEYMEKEDVRAFDLYVYNNRDFYQIISRDKKDDFSVNKANFDFILNSFQITE